MSSDDVAHAATLAVRTLADESRLAQLGVTFLSAFFRASLQHPDTIAVKAVSEAGQTVGYALASADTHAFRRHVQPRIALHMARALLNPRRIHLLSNMVLGLREAEPEPPVPSELLLLYVEPTSKRQGVGSKLLQSVETAFVARDIRRYRVAVRSQLGDARAFYQAVGFVFEQELPVLGEPMTYLVRAL
jgi:ribosomal protein S18 acetylase RimI-like enzyme